MAPNPEGSAPRCRHRGFRHRFFHHADSAIV